jgi:acetyl-CoA acetyltransferase
MAFDTPNLRGKVAIVGAADAVSPNGVLKKTIPALHAQVTKEALDDAGLRPSDVDAIFTAGATPMASLELAEYLGMFPRYSDTTMTGGSSFEMHVEHAAAALAFGLCDVALVTFAQTPRAPGAIGPGQRRRDWDPTWPSPLVEWELPYGMRLPVGGYSLAASRHMAEFGTRPEDLAEIAVSTRSWAAKNPRARYREALTVQEVLASPFVCEPLHKLDCCLVTDGAGAIVLTRADRAEHLKQPPAYVLGVGSRHTHAIISAMPDLTVTPGAVSGPKAFGMAGIGPSDVDVLESYDSFTITVLLALEDLGFCPKGEGGRFVQGGRLGPDGSLPTNTNGGGLSYTHPGMYGMFLLVEAVRQIRGEAGPRQVEGAEIAVAHGCGGVLSATSTVVLGKQSTV